MLMITILLVDDDPHIRAIIREYAQAENWQFTEAGNGEEAMKLVANAEFSLLVLDVMMPRLDGWDTLTIDNELIALTPKEYELLSFFASRPGVAFTRDQLLNHVWGYDYFGDAR